MLNRKKILFVVQYPQKISPGQRFRFELYENLLSENNFEVATQSFFDQNAAKIMFKHGHFFKKFLASLKGLLRRTILIFTIHKYDFILLQREFTPFGPSFFEWYFMKILKKRIIYDFDDAIWIDHISDQNKLAAMVKNVDKVPKICTWAFKVSCGNQYLCKYAERYNKKVIYNPTCVDTETMHNIACDHYSEKVTIGWTGSFSTLKYIDTLIPVITRLQEKYDFNFKIICNQRPNLKIKNFQFVKWSPENEIIELATCQIGIMPLADDEWSKGKCGFKLIQYMALEIPAVASPVGVNSTIIDDGINGYLSNTENEWFNALEKLLNNPALRSKMGKKGREKIQAQYSLKSNATNFLSLFSD